jgi:hypothetical protein
LTGTSQQLNNSTIKQFNKNEDNTFLFSLAAGAAVGSL